jgi:nicotinate-nucleotide adenylyltransferase
MLRLAIAGHEAFVISELEIARGGVTYTVDTLTALQEQQPQDELFFLMGADSLRDLPGWRDTARICELAVPVVVRRRDTPEPDFGVLAGMVSGPRLQEIRRHQVQMPLVDFSSTAIRQAVAASRSIRYQTPRAVEKYIQTQGLYCEEGKPA